MPLPAVTHLKQLWKAGQTCGLAEAPQISPWGTIVTPRPGQFEFWDATGASNYQSPGGKVALFQGRINGRVDFDLFVEVARKMPDWQFWFAAIAAAPELDGADTAK